MPLPTIEERIKKLPVGTVINAQSYNDATDSWLLVFITKGYSGQTLVDTTCNVVSVGSITDFSIVFQPPKEATS